MRARSLALTTDLGLLATRGARIVDRGDYIVVETPDDPGYFLGNLLALPAASAQSNDKVTHAEIPRSVSLTWNAPAGSSTPDGYNVYRGTASGGPYAKLNQALLTSRSYVDQTVLAGQQWYYVVSAVYGTSETANSNEAPAFIFWYDAASVSRGIGGRGGAFGMPCRNSCAPNR